MNYSIILFVACALIMGVIFYKMIRYGFGNPASLAVLNLEFILGCIILGCSWILGFMGLVIIWAIFLGLIFLQVSVGCYIRKE